MCVEKYFDQYTKLDVQKVEDAKNDSQINSISLFLRDFVSGKLEGGTIVDIGCGNGIVFNRLISYPDFLNNNKFLYFGTDEISKLKQINDLALENKLLRRIELITLDEFYDSRISNYALNSPMLFICRNVLHELDIDATADFFYYIKQNIGDNKLIIQDLLNFKHGERGNVCWEIETYKKMLESIGLESVVDVQESKSGARWFSSIITNNGKEYDRSQIFDIVLNSRKNQYEIFVQKYNCSGYDNEQDLKEVVDSDIQLAALAAQLAKCGEAVKLPKNDGTYVKKVFNSAINSIDLTNFPICHVEQPQGFRDRANAQDTIETTLKIQKCRFQIVGGRKIGKQYLIKRVLSHRAFGKSTIFVDVYKSSNVWNILEQIYESIGIHLQQEIILALSDIDYNDVKESVSECLNYIGDKIIVVFKHFENLLDENNNIIDKNIKLLIKDIIKTNVSCVIFLTKKICMNSIFEDIKPIRIGVFPEDRHVVNILDDYVDRSGDNNIEYPPELIGAIGKHPYLTYFAANIIKKHGVENLTDTNFIYEIKNRLWRELTNRLIDEHTKPIVQTLSMLRVPTPIVDVSTILPLEDIQAAINDGLVTKTYENNEELISVFNYLDIENSDEKDDMFNEDELKNIAKMYEQAYKRSNNALWLREYFYFSTCLNEDKNIVFGKIYFNDIREASQYWYRAKRRYDLCLWACEKLQEMGDKSDDTNILKACCLFRVPGDNNIETGTSIFTKIINNHPKVHIYKTRYIDSLIYIGEYYQALQKLHEYRYDNTSIYWNAVQYAKCYMGIYDYDNAIVSFNNAGKFEKDRRNYINLSKCYYKKGDFENELKVLESTYKLYGDCYILNMYANALMRSGKKDNIIKAGELLKKSFDEKNGLPYILSSYCKFLCRNLEVDKAKIIIKDFQFCEEDKQIKQQMLMEIYMAENKLEKCKDIIDNMNIATAVKDALYKRIYLYFARKNHDSDIAMEGLRIKIPAEYRNDIPLHLTQMSLATYANRQDIVVSEKKRILELNDRFAIEEFDYELDSAEDADYINE